MPQALLLQANPAQTNLLLSQCESCIVESRYDELCVGTAFLGAPLI